MRRRSRPRSIAASLDSLRQLALGGQDRAVFPDRPELADFAVGAVGVALALAAHADLEHAHEVGRGAVSRLARGVARPEVIARHADAERAWHDADVGQGPPHEVE